ncbi:glycosyltransferase family 1 protein [Oceanirhabdus sp. W0125-5]|uniref:glycosyltransferase family 1 protein n=1 Tax=Oceanirhabdus sp. W0125-5 TaxID=2999116 RepID=UPI0022F323B8|nr:glycosyltransferase family 1 protein [Oceanirhabdus sp. W0125-5]WBW98948.1 glycosyltransferase family 1 protein [Oceanirhabdus sp. W0125-5]
MDKPIRVLHVVVNMNRGGAETLIMNLYRNIDRTKVQFDFLVHKDVKGAFEDEIISLGGKIHRIPYITDVGHFGYKKALYKFFKNHSDYKIVHAHMDSMSGLVLQAAKKAEIPSRISHSHNTRNEGNSLARLYKSYISNRIIKNSNQLFACSDVAAKWLFKNHSNRAKVIKNGIDIEKFLFNGNIRDLKREELGISDDTLVLGHVARFNHQKNHTFLIDIFEEVHKRKSDSLLLLVGDGALRGSIEEKVRRLNLENSVKFLGVRDDVNELLQALDIFLLPSLHEGLPVTLIEAQAVGLNCVISDTITKEVDLGASLMEFISLSESNNKWAEKLLSLNIINKDATNELRKNGYDIQETAIWLQRFYSNI